MKTKLLILTIAAQLALCAHVFAQNPGSVYPGSLDTRARLGETANNAFSTLAAQMTASDTTASLVNASKFASTGFITIGSEIISYSGKSGNSLTGLIRGEDGTAASSHVVGNSVEMRVVSKIFKIHADALIAIETKLGAGSDINATKLQGRSLANTAPTDGQAIVWSVSNDRWQPGTVAGSGGSIAVREVDGTPSISPASTLEFLQSSGFVVTDQTSGVARVDLNGIPYAKLNLSGSIVNADVSASAAIGYSKLNLTGAILNADLAGSIAYSKLNLTGSIVDGDIVSITTRSKLPSPIAYEDEANTFAAGIKQTFQNSAATAGFNLASSADPSSPAQGDVWLNASTLKFRGASASFSISGNNTGDQDLSGLITASSTDSLTHKTYDTAGTGNVFKINGAQITSIGSGLSIAGGVLDATGGGGGSGTVNSGTQYQAAYYATTGTAVSGASSLVTDTNSNWKVINRLGVGVEPSTNRAMTLMDVSNGATYFQFKQAGTAETTIGVENGAKQFLVFKESGGLYLWYVDPNGNTIQLGSLSTVDPTSGQGPAWKLGARKAATVTLDTTQYVEVNIGGTTYKLAVVN